MSPVCLTELQVQALENYVSLVRERFGQNLVDILLFGSAARGDATPGSDIDVAVLLNRPTARDLADARGLAFDVWLAQGVLLSIRAMSRQGWRELAEMHSIYLQNLLQDGISLLNSCSVETWGSEAKLGVQNS